MVDQATADNIDSPIISSNVWVNNIFGLRMPGNVDILSVAYALTVAAGGSIGYFTKGSIPSLVAGLSFGAILGVGAWMTSNDPRNYWLLLVTSGALAGLMGYRFYNSGKFMPAGLVFTLSSLMLIRFSLRFITNRNYI